MTKSKNKAYARKRALKWNGTDDTAKDSMRASRRSYGDGLSK